MLRSKVSAQYVVGLESRCLDGQEIRHGFQDDGAIRTLIGPYISSSTWVPAGAICTNTCIICFCLVTLFIHVSKSFILLL